jgi:hypothetical protein
MLNANANANQTFAEGFNLVMMKKKLYRDPNVAIGTSQERLAIFMHQNRNWWT